MAKANCSVCGGGIDTESSPSGKCVRCSERASRTKPAPPTLPGAEQYPVPKALGGGTLHYTRTPEGEHYGAIVPAPPPAFPSTPVMPPFARIAPDQTLTAGELARAKESLAGPPPPTPGVQPPDAGAVPTVHAPPERRHTHAPDHKKHG